MKKTIFFIALLAIGFGSHAQITKGRSMLGIRFNYGQTGSSQDYTDTSGVHSNYTYNNSRFSPGINYGYMLSDHFMLGFTANYQQAKDERVDPHYYVYSTKFSMDQKIYNAGLFARYYQRIKESKFYIFGQVTATYGHGSRTEKEVNTNPVNSATNSHSSFNTFNVYIYPGILYMVNKTIGLETSFGNIGFQHSNEKTYDDKNFLVRSTNSNNFDSNILLQFSSLSIGINFYFGGKRA